ncbi:hypothetical protein HanXRQr2_Chr10g0423351 [Helianthus annuus]|uniref:Uncharacterized protein n=1 Tax=Helianthus annuus TaxID=4232 RepID=A0A251TGU0_HELAN|nr:hypothetical protein HanXRQr2_Chr10g0423351 [Helianthus annuus]KAJ0512611.1 hypothetical protein HanHA300_Chr10g0348101 [Helianthus annuus]KAJ0520189.1 hypothetical protein HanIR_Chr10g0456601 [Helianthus annuus]KAJ0528738.1 hypothetical protein HanHA89_Chr10g0369731 [Helianthus annuus]KAJ0695654.1 hypothetical protein HanLR1_Chr10g0347931 [Helianthus annuus]
MIQIRVLYNFSLIAHGHKPLPLHLPIGFISYRPKSLTTTTTTATAMKDGGSTVSEKIRDELSFYEPLGIPETE